MSFDDYKRLITIDDEGFITNTTGANKFYEKDLLKDKLTLEEKDFLGT